MKNERGGFGTDLLLSLFFGVNAKKKSFDKTSFCSHLLAPMIKMKFPKLNYKST